MYITRPNHHSRYQLTVTAHGLLADMLNALPVSSVTRTRRLGATEVPQWGPGAELTMSIKGEAVYFYRTADFA